MTSATARLRKPLFSRNSMDRVTATSVLTWVAGICFLVLLLAILASVVLDSFAGSWTSGWLPTGWNGHSYSQAWSNYGVKDALLNTFESAIVVVGISLLLGVPAGYVLARRDFPYKNVVMLFLMLPVMLPPMTYVVQLATLLYSVGIAGSLTGVIVANLVPAVPFVVLVTVPFVEQINPNIENAARVFGADIRRVFTRILIPILLPGMLAAGILTLVRVLGAFELTFFTAGPTSQTLIVALYGAASNPGGLPEPLISAMAVCYMGVSAALLGVSLKFVNPTQVVSRNSR